VFPDFWGLKTPKVMIFSNFSFFILAKSYRRFIDDLAILSKKKYERQNIEECFYILGYHIGTFCRISGISKNKINW
jgi:hypothetical protein